MKQVLVTGAYGGMGRAAVEVLVSRGYKVFALDKKVGQARDGVTLVECDITDEESVLSAFAFVKEQCEELYAIIHFAGRYMLDSFVELDGESLAGAFEVNLLGAARINRIFLPLLSEGSRILITTSELAALDPLPFTGIYAVTKAALDKYAYSLAMELQLLGIRVSVLRAGAVKTDMLGVSTDALDRFCKETKLYSCNAERFKSIVDKVEARSISTEKLARRAVGIIEKRHPAFVYSINRNPLLLLMNILPKRLRFFIIGKLLK